MISTSDFEFSNEEWNWIMSECYFTEFQKQILELKRNGLADIDVAAELEVSHNTITKYKLKAYNKIIKLIKARM